MISLARLQLEAKDEGHRGHPTPTAGDTRTSPATACLLCALLQGVLLAEVIIAVVSHAPSTSWSHSAFIGRIDFTAPWLRASSWVGEP